MPLKKALLVQNSLVVCFIINILNVELPLKRTLFTN